MQPKKIVKFSNIIGIISILLLIYWIFIFILTEICGLKVFQRNLSELFFASIMGILALMFGALMINIMFNLTRIANRSQDADSINSKSSKLLKWGFILSFPILFGLIAGASHLTTKKKENKLILAGKSIIIDYADKIEQLADYQFSLDWVRRTDTIVTLLGKTDKHFPHISVIVNDTVENKNVYLKFSTDYYSSRDSVISPKMKYIRETTLEERIYLKDVFENGNSEMRFSKYDGQYELFLPYLDGKRRIVLYFSEYDRYGKIGSYK